MKGTVCPQKITKESTKDQDIPYGKIEPTRRLIKHGQMINQFHVVQYMEEHKWQWISTAAGLLV